MKQNAIATAVLALAFSTLFIGHAQAHGNSVSQSAGFQGDIGGQLTTFSGTGSVGATSVANGSSVSAGEVLGNGGFEQQASGKTTGIAGGTAVVTPTGVEVSTITEQSSVSKGSGWTSGNVPITAADGSIITGNQTFGSETNNAAAAGTFQTGAIGANLAIGANEAIQANEASGFN